MSAKHRPRPASIIERAARAALTGIRAAVVTSGFDDDDRRAVEIYLLVTACNLPGAIAADAAGCSKQNVSKLLRAVEDRRERPDYEIRLGRLEAMIVGEV